MVRNADEPVRQMFPAPGWESIVAPESTGAHGTPGATGEGDSPLMTVPVSELYESTQSDQRDRVDVGTGDTSGMSDDVPAHALPGMPDEPAYMSTGAGEGNPDPYAHPNAGA